ncbi:MAG TPA: GrpB family protein [Streptosporangiaceae bacterium]|jgi:GrpB-like predicted nucleotidyltransferase (UPF0157 family)|nr:GrpB family protein [Streptosporangiaceae bacterium]
MAAALVGEPPAQWQSIVIEDYDPVWPGRFTAASSRLREDRVLGAQIIGIEHVGSTSVPGLAAKPVIDIDLLLADTSEEARYLPALAGLGYRLVLREPWWYGHRMLVSPAADVNLHLWPQDAPEPIRHRLFRDWLRAHLRRGRLTGRQSADQFASFQPMLKTSPSSVMVDRAARSPPLLPVISSLARPQTEPLATSPVVS